MITKTEALSPGPFHVVRERNQKPGATCYVWRRNGQTQTWKTRPNDFRVPVKYGLRNYGQITPANAHLFHTEANCPYGGR